MHRFACNDCLGVSSVYQETSNLTVGTLPGGLKTAQETGWPLLDKKQHLHIIRLE